MSSVVLFSPIGGTDPISNTNYYDGAMLHICRKYSPDKVYMYMSQFVLKCENEDNRYTYCLEQLYRSKNKDLNYEAIERPDLVEVEDFDYFYDDFKRELNRVSLSMEDGDTLLINISSGTPAMKSALVVLVTLGAIDGILVQVVTPEKGINTHDHKNYDVKTLWELNPDNSDVYTDRCREIHCPTLAIIKQEEIIKKLIKVYDYSAALEVARLIPEDYSSNYIHLLEMANNRRLLDYESVLDLARRDNFPLFIIDNDENERKTLEYVLETILKYKRNEYADFVKMLTPAILNIFILLIKKQLGVDFVNECCTYRKGVMIDINKMKSNLLTSEWLTCLDNAYLERGKGRFKAGFLTSEPLLCIITKYICNDEILQNATFLREVEKVIRNTAAHEIAIITPDMINEKIGYTCEEIIDSTKKLIAYTSIRCSPDDWNSYERMNDYICERISVRI